MSERLCVFCEHMANDSYEVYASGGGGDYFYCRKAHFTNLGVYIDSEWRAVIRKAETCPDYAEAK